MTMRVDLMPELEAFIAERVASGMYSNAADVIRHAIRQMQHDETRVAAWLAAVNEGAMELDRGEGIFYTPEVAADIKQSAINACRAETLRHGGEIVSHEKPVSAAAIFDVLATFPNDFLAEGRNDTPPQTREGC